MVRSRRYSGTGRLIFAASIAVLGAFHVANARADVATCIEAHKSGQRAKIEGHLRRAARLFTTCSADATCPNVLRNDCSRFLDETNRAIPTVTFAVVEDDNKDITDVKIYSDDELISTSLNGRAVELDPGPHHLRFVLPKGQASTQDVLIRESEKDRLIRVKIATRSASSDPAASRPAAAPPASKSRPPAGAWIAASGAVAALATGVTLGVIGAGKQDELDQCKPSCPPSMRPTYDSAKALFLGADIAFGAAIVASGIATWLFLSPPRSDERASAPARNHISVGMSPAPGGAALVVESLF